MMKQQFIKQVIDEDYELKYESFDKIIKNTCNSRRPDFFIELLTHVIIFAIDENQHKYYNEECERRRIDELYTGFADRPIIFIRFNPDKYKIKMKNGSVATRNPRFNTRMEVLETELKKHIERIENYENQDILEIHYLYYDEI